VTLEERNAEAAVQFYLTGKNPRLQKAKTENRYGWSPGVLAWTRDDESTSEGVTVARIRATQGFLDAADRAEYFRQQEEARATRYLRTVGNDKPRRVTTRGYIKKGGR